MHFHERDAMPTLILFPTESNAATKAIAFGPKHEMLANSMWSVPASPPRGLLLRVARDIGDAAWTRPVSTTEIAATSVKCASRL